MTCTQTRLHMGNRNFRIESRQRPTQSRRRIALNHKEVKAILQDLRQTFDNAGSGVEQRLTRRHNVEIIIRDDVEHIQHLIEEIPMLGRHTDAGFEL